MAQLPVYTPSNSRLSRSFVLSDVAFGHPGAIEPGPASRKQTYARYQIGTAYALPFVFEQHDATAFSLRVFLPPQDNDRYWLIGGEVVAGESLGDTLVQFLREQAGVVVEDSQRVHLVGLSVWDLQRWVTLRMTDQRPVPRHELARVVGYAMTGEAAAQIELPDGVDPAEYWFDVFTIQPGPWRSDAALVDIVDELAARVLTFHGLPIPTATA